MTHVLGAYGGNLFLTDNMVLPQHSLWEKKKSKIQKWQLNKGWFQKEVISVKTQTIQTMFHFPNMHTFTHKCTERYWMYDSSHSLL